MSKEGSNGFWWFVCDKCGATTEQMEDFNELVEKAKKDNWFIGAGVHKCPSCAWVPQMNV